MHWVGRPSLPTDQAWLRLGASQILFQIISVGGDRCQGFPPLSLLVPFMEIGGVSNARVFDALLSLRVASCPLSLHSGLLGWPMLRVSTLASPCPTFI